MTRWRNLLLAAAVLGLYAAPASAQMPLATTADVVAAAKQCVRVTGPNGVDIKTLVADGWAKGTMRGADELGFYARTGNNALLMTGPGADKPDGVCFATARIGGTRDYIPTAEAISAALGTKPFSKDGNTIRWMADRRLIQLDATGTREKLSVRVSVAAIPQESK